MTFRREMSLGFLTPFARNSTIVHAFNRKYENFFARWAFAKQFPIRAKSRCERPAGTLKAWARELGLDDAGGLLEETLEEEKDTDATLTEMAESVINRRVEAAE
jgi:uncharacterized protein DUF892